MALTLSGPFDTAQLPRIASEPVTVTVARTVAPGSEAAYLQWTDDVVATLRRFD
jgi:antibiotic biosynthesis monooxygenase (ABM) superfamily enzyme